MKIYVLDSIEKVSFFRDSNQIVARVNSILYQVVAENQLHQLLMNYQLSDERSGDDSNFIVTTNEHFTLLENQFLKRNSDDANPNRSLSEERIVNVLEEAIKQKASDVHFIRGDSTARIKFRINGKMTINQEVMGAECDEMLFVLYNVMASTKETTWNTKTPQDANILLDVNRVGYRFRYAHMPIFGVGVGGSAYHAVVRVIYPNLGKQVCTDLSTLGLRKIEEKIIDRILSNPSGLVVVSGVTGSGKSTSLKNYMEYLFYTKYQETGTFLTVEDPVEYVIEGAQQSSVTKSKDDENLFAVAVRSSMRRDPDVLMIGEIRDQDTGRALASAVESGHLCLTTVHAGNCVGVLQRLNGLGVGLDKLSTPGFIVGVMNQKLVPVICPDCSVEFTNAHGRTVRHEGDGCETCKQKGIVGRKLVIEQMIPDLEVLKMVSEQQWVDIYAYNKSKRSTEGLGEGFSIKDKIYHLCLEGLVCNKYFNSSYGEMELEDENIVFSVYQSKE
ncbi:MAG: ATPase, T2SS/T4P/T4SS family [Vibrionaceae bacterium]